MDIIQENIRVIQSLSGKRRIEVTDEIVEMIELMAETYSYSISGLQEAYIRNLNFILPYIEKMYRVTEDMEWPYQAQLILEGNFPLEKIPAHVRELTEKLYYHKKD